MTTTHTPGPWRLERSRVDGTRVIYDASDFPICRITANTSIVGMERERSGAHEANARLIASAPALLAALEMAIPQLEYAHAQHLGSESGKIHAAIQAARAAIAAAKGE